jgi:hypothetical protein
LQEGKLLWKLNMIEKDETGRITLEGRSLLD